MRRRYAAEKPDSGAGGKNPPDWSTPMNGEESSAPKSNDTPATVFAMAEYQFLRKEIESSVQELRLLEKGVVVATGVVWSWLATHPPVPFWAWFIPTLFAVLGGLRVRALNSSIGLIGDYILEEVEPRQIQKGDMIGWEKFFRKDPIRRHRVGLTAKTFWIALILTTLIVPVLILLANVLMSTKVHGYSQACEYRGA